MGHIRAREFNSLFTIWDPAQISCARRKKQGPERKTTQCVNLRTRKNIPGPEARKSSNRHNVFISCAAQPTHLRTKKKHLPFWAVFGPRQIVRAQDSKQRIKFACPKPGDAPYASCRILRLTGKLGNHWFSLHFHLELRTAD